MKQTYAQKMTQWRARRERIRQFVAEGNSLAAAAIKFKVTKARIFQLVGRRT